MNLPPLTTTKTVEKTVTTLNRPYSELGAVLAAAVTVFVLWAIITGRAPRP